MTNTGEKAKQVEIRHGNTAEVDTFTPAASELVHDTDENSIRVGDGSTRGGHRIPIGVATTAKLGTTQYSGISAGFSIKSDHYNGTTGSGANLQFTGVITVGNAGLVPATDGFFHDADGRQFENTDEILVLSAFGSGISAFNAIIEFVKVKGGGNMLIPIGTHTVPNINVQGVDNLVIGGLGAGSVIDLAGSTNASAFRIGWDLTLGGCKHIKLSNLSITNSSASPIPTKLLAIEGGATGNSPSTTVGFITLENVSFLEYTKSNGTLVHLDNLSHVEFSSVFQPFDQGYQYGLVVTNSIDINTGVMNFDNCAFRGNETGCYIHADSQLIDSIAFDGCGFFNNDNAAALSALRIRGEDSAVAGVTFSGCHVEARNNAVTSEAILFEGKVNSCSWDGMHISAGAASSPQADYGVRFSNDPTTGTSVFKANEFKATEFLRVSGTGAAWKFDNDITTEPKEPNVIGSFWLNSTTPDHIEVSTGNNAQEILKSIVSHGAQSEQATRDKALLDLNDSATPSVSGGERFQFTGTPSITTITDFIDEYDGQLIHVINNSTTSMTVAHDVFKIKLVDGKNLILNGGEAASFIKTGNGFWNEISSAVSRTSADVSSITSASSKTVNDANVKSSSKIVLTASDPACATVMGSSKSLYVTGKATGSFVVATADATNVVGTCNFNYYVWND